MPGPTGSRPPSSAHRSAECHCDSRVHGRPAPTSARYRRRSRPAAFRPRGLAAARTLRTAPTRSTYTRANDRPERLTRNSLGIRSRGTGRQNRASPKAPPKRPVPWPRSSHPAKRLVRCHPATKLIPTAHQAIPAATRRPPTGQPLSKTAGVFPCRPAGMRKRSVCRPGSNSDSGSLHRTSGAWWSPVVRRGPRFPHCRLRPPTPAQSGFHPEKTAVLTAPRDRRPARGPSHGHRPAPRLRAEAVPKDRPGCRSSRTKTPEHQWFWP